MEKEDKPKFIEPGDIPKEEPEKELTYEEQSEKDFHEDNDGEEWEWQ